MCRRPSAASWPVRRSGLGRGSPFGAQRLPGRRDGGKPDVRLQRRWLGTADQARQDQEQGQAPEHAEGELGDLLPADAGPAAHRALQPRRRIADAPGAAIVVRRFRGSSPSREYELVLMLDPDIPEERREQIAAEARTRIESGGSLKQDTAWGMRKLAYEIEQRTEADYRFFRFETEGGLLDDLNHNLRIADGVLRFRIFKVDPRSPAIVPPAADGSAAAPGSGRPPPAGPPPEREESLRPRRRARPPRRRRRRCRPSEERGRAGPRGSRREEPGRARRRRPRRSPAGRRAGAPSPKPSAQAASCGFRRRPGGEKRRSRP